MALSVLREEPFCFGESFGEPSGDGSSEKLPPRIVALEPIRRMSPDVDGLPMIASESAMLPMPSGIVSGVTDTLRGEAIVHACQSPKPPLRLSHIALILDI